MSFFKEWYSNRPQIVTLYLRGGALLYKSNLHVPVPVYTDFMQKFL